MTQAPEFGARRAVTSAAQDGLWFVDTCVHESPSFHVCRAYRVFGELDVDALRFAWAALVARHESLRTSLTSRDGRPTQLIASELAAASSFTDLGTVPPLAGDFEARRWAADLAGGPIDLAAGPLARLVVTRVSGQEHLVVLLLHAAVADDESTSVVIEELSALYAAEAHQLGDQLPPARAQYADFARWQRRRSAAGRFRPLMEWWADALTPAPPSLTLPVDHARGASPAPDGGLVSFDWGDRVARPLATLCAAHRASPFSVLLAAFSVLLHRYGGDERVAVAVPVPVRSRPEFARIVGACREPVAVCSDVVGSLSFRELLERVTSVADDALRHRGLPFDQLVRAFNPDRDLRVPPLSGAAFVYRGEPESSLSLPGVEVRPVALDFATVRADLTLTVDCVDPVVRGSLAFRAGMFERSSGLRIVDQLRTLLVGALADPDLSVDSLPLDEVRRMRAAVRDADWIEVGEPVRCTVAEQVHRVAEQQPDAPAVVLGADSLTYGELVARAAAVTRALGSSVHGQAVAVRVPTGPRQVAALLGVLDAGAHLVCIGTGDNGQRGRAVLADLRPVALVLDGPPDNYELIDWYRDELDGRIIDLAELPAAGEPVSPSGIGLDDRAYVAYTSGSTGRPKGIAQTHLGFAQFVAWWSGEFGIAPGGRVAQWAAAGYDASLVEIFGALVAGGTLYSVPDKIHANPEKIAEWLVAERITLFQTVPSFAREVGRAVSSLKLAGSLGSLDHLLLAGEALPGELAGSLRSLLPAARLVNLYGPTESILATWYEVNVPVVGPVPIGRPIPGRQVLVLDSRDRPCPAGTVGQIVIRSPYIQASYVGAAAPERSAFRPVDGLDEYRVADGVTYRTGDFARRRWDGLLEFRGRGDFQVKFHGTRVELTDVEATLLTHESVAECAVVGVPNADGLVTRLIAYVVPRRGPDGRAVAAADVWRAHLRAWFGRSKLPVTFKTVIGLPRNLGGKVDRARLPDPGVASTSEATHAPRTPVERVMASIWAELVGVAPQTTDDSFFAVGGHSLLVPQLLERIRDRFGVAVSVREYVSHPTVLGLSGLVDDKLVSTMSVTDKVMGEKT